MDLIIDPKLQSHTIHIYYKMFTTNMGSKSTKQKLDSYVKPWKDQKGL